MINKKCIAVTENKEMQRVGLGITAAHIRYNGSGNVFLFEGSRQVGSAAYSDGGTLIHKCHFSNAKGYSELLLAALLKTLSGLSDPPTRVKAYLTWSRNDEIRMEYGDADDIVATCMQGMKTFTRFGFKEDYPTAPILLESRYDQSVLLQDALVYVKDMDLCSVQQFSDKDELEMTLKVKIDN